MLSGNTTAADNSVCEVVSTDQREKKKRDQKANRLRKKRAAAREEDDEGECEFDQPSSKRRKQGQDNTKCTTLV